MLIHDSSVTVTSLTCHGATASLTMASHLEIDVNNIKSSFPHPGTGDDVFIFLDHYCMVKLVINPFGTYKYY